MHINSAQKRNSIATKPYSNTVTTGKLEMEHIVLVLGLL